MKLTVEKQPLAVALAGVIGAVETRGSIPILKNIKLEAVTSSDGGRLIITATDLDVEITEECPAEITDAGALTVPGAMFADIAKAMPDGAQIELSLTKDTQFAIHAGRSKYELPTLPAGDYPLMVADDFTVTATVDAPDFLAMLETVGFAISTETTRHYLNGVNLSIVGGNLRSVTTDGHRLALSDMALPGHSVKAFADMPNVIIPAKTVGLILRLLSGLKSEVTLSISDAKIQIKTNDATLTSKLIDGTFPDYERVIPKDNPHTLTVNAKVFASAVGRVMLISAEKARSLRFVLSADTLLITARGEETGKAEEELMVDYEGPDMEIGFNGKYVTDVLAKIKGRDAVIAFDVSSAPAKVTDPDSENNLFVLMPHRV